MPKVKLEYNLPEEKYDYTLAINGYNFYRCLSEIDLYLRNCLKYGHEFKTIDAALENIRNIIREESHLDCIEDL